MKTLSHYPAVSRAGLKPKQYYPILTWSTGGEFNFVALYANFAALYAKLICNQCVKLKMIKLTNTTAIQIHEASWTLQGAE